MMGLAHRGFELFDYSHHIVHTLRGAGYWSGLIGEQHLSREPGVLGYDHVVESDTNHVDYVAPAAVELIAQAPSQPFFLSVGFFETHREYFEPTSVRDALYSLPPDNLPDTPETRRDMAAFNASARSLDAGVGAVLDEIDALGLRDDTLVICTTDHGMAFPGAKTTLTDRGIGVFLILRGPGGFTGGEVSDALVSHIDLYPTICDLAGVPRPEFLQGASILPLMDGAAAVRDEVFAEGTYHAAYEPQRAIRTDRWKYIRRFDDRPTPVLANTDDSPGKDLWLRHGWAEHELAGEQLYDLVFDPQEQHNLIAREDHASVAADLRTRLDAWMRDTDDPLLDGPVAPLPGAEEQAQRPVRPHHAALRELERLERRDPGDGGHERGRQGRRGHLVGGHPGGEEDRREQ